MSSVSRAVHDREFYRAIRAGSESSAQVVVRLLSEVLSCRSVVDFGCGTGLWLKAFGSLGVEDLTGVDGDHVEADALVIDPRQFVNHDLNEPLDLGRRFDLAICLEVAEHLPDASGAVLLDSITRHSEQVLFSAGIPQQTGAGHLSGRWQSDWVQDFRERGFVAIDLIRPRVWHDPNVEYWYAQNTLLFVTPPVLQANAALRRFAEERSPIIDIVHPAHYSELKGEIWHLRNPGVVALLRQTRGAILRSLRRPFRGHRTPC